MCAQPPLRKIDPIALTDPQRHIQRLLDGLTDEGLEDLTLRLFRPEYPDAHGVRGNDGGIDVLSDYETPPARGFQAKSYKAVPWVECRDSLRAAMNGDKPRHYSFVFPFQLTKNQRNFWRDDFLPEQEELYPDLVLDCVDDLVFRVEERPDLVNLLSDDTYAKYFRTTMALAAAEGVNPLASAADLVADPLAMAEHAKQVGKRDPHFRYGFLGREAASGDAEIADRGVRFIMNHGVESLPNFSIAIRDGDRVAELHAEPRDGAPDEPPVPWFATDQEGQEALRRARATLARGETIELSGEAVGVRPAAVPDRFRTQLTEDGLLRNGIVRLGLSESISLRIELTFGDTVAGETIAFYRLPVADEGTVSYGGCFNGIIVTLDLESAQGDADGKDTRLELGLGIAFGDEPARQAIVGLGFAEAYGKADRVRLECPELLPDEGLEFAGEDGDGHNREVWEMAAVIGAALTALEDRDGKVRRMPEDLTLSDLYAAQMILPLLTAGEVEVAVEEEAELPLLGEEVEGKDPADFLDSDVEMPPIAGQASNLIVRRKLIEVEALEVIETESGIPRLRVRPAGEHARVVINLAES